MALKDATMVNTQEDSEMEDSLKHPLLKRKQPFFMGLAAVATIGLLLPVLIIALDSRDAHNRGLGAIKVDVDAGYTKYVNVL